MSGASEHPLAKPGGRRLTDPATLPDAYGSAAYWDGVWEGDDRRKAVKAVERLVRTSMELKDYIKHLRDELDMKRCSLIKGAVVGKAKVEIHHHPLTLYEVVDLAAERRRMLGKPFSEVQVAEEVVRLHYENKVGLVPLATTAHQLAHSGDLDVGLDHVFGDVAALLVEYSAVVPDSMVEKVKRAVARSRDPAPRSEGLAVLKIGRTAWGALEESGNGLVEAIEDQGQEDQAGGGGQGRAGIPDASGPDGAGRESGFGQLESAQE